MLRSPHCTLHTHPSNLRSGHERARKEMVSVRSTRWFCRETVLARGCGDRSHVHQVRRTHMCVCVCMCMPTQTMVNRGGGGGHSNSRGGDE